MLCKVFLCSLLVAYAIDACAATGTNCTVTPLENGLSEEECGNRAVLKDASGNELYVERVLFENKVLSVLELNDDNSSCYVIQNSEFPEGVDHTQSEKIEQAEEAEPCESTAVQDFVPACRGRTVYNLKSQAENETESNAGRKKRGICIRFRCRRYIIRNRRTGRTLYRRTYCRWWLVRC